MWIDTIYSQSERFEMARVREAANTFRIPKHIWTRRANTFMYIITFCIRALLSLIRSPAKRLFPNTSKYVAMFYDEMIPVFSESCSSICILSYIQVTTCMCVFYKYISLHISTLYSISVYLCRYIVWVVGTIADLTTIQFNKHWCTLAERNVHFIN